MNIDVRQLMDQGMALLEHSRETTGPEGDKSLAMQQLEAAQAQTYVLAALVQLVAEKD